MMKLRKHLGFIAITAWLLTILVTMTSAGEAKVVDLGSGFNISWTQLLGLIAFGAWAGKVSTRLDSIEKSLEKKADRHEHKED